MAYTTFGWPAVAGTADAAPYTIITTDNPALTRGILKRTQVYISANSNGCKIKIFRDDGTNYLFVGESPATNLLAGLNDVPMWVPVEKGDLIALYSPNSGAGTHADISNAGQSPGCYYRAGDITSNSAKNTWSSLSYKLHIQGYAFSRTPPILP